MSQILNIKQIKKEAKHSKREATQSEKEGK
jgi:hypothetical protein